MELRNKTLAIIVSYNGGESTINTANALLKITDNVLIIDNGSTQESLRLLGNIKTKVKLMEIGKNLGIGHALNIGASYASANNFEWILTMDQDTCVDPKLLECYENYFKEHEQVEFMTPTTWIHGNKPRVEKSKILNYVITSGNLIHIKLVNRIGGYNEALFIDGVDFDFCLRARLAGAKIHLVENAIIHHALGNRHMHSHNLLSRFYSDHAPVRRYYIFRNFIFLLKKFWLKFPSFAIKTTAAHIFMFIAIWIYEDKSSAKASSKLILQGLSDGFNNKFGPHQQQ